MRFPKTQRRLPKQLKNYRVLDKHRQRLATKTPPIQKPKNKKEYMELVKKLIEAAKKRPVVFP